MRALNPQHRFTTTQPRSSPPPPVYRRLIREVKSSSVTAVLHSNLVEPLEARRLLSGAPLSAAARLIGLDRLADAFPQLDGSGQTVAIIDTGIDYTHPALGGGFGPGFKVVAGWDFVDNDPDPMDTDGHGTSVAGIVAADPFVQDGVTYRGIAPASKLVALRIGATTGSTPNTRIAAALQWVLDNRQTYNITAVNISFGSGNFASAPDNGDLSVELANLAEAGVLVIAAAGNGGATSNGGIEYPAADRSAIAVGSVNTFDVISDFSKRGRLLDVLAPGEGWVTPTLAGKYRVVSGTSFAAPVVTATAAMLKQVMPGLALPDARSILRASGTDNFDGDDEFGQTTGMLFSRVDVTAAATLVTARRPDSLAPEPTWELAQNNTVRYDEHGVFHVAFHDAATRTLRYATQLTTGQWAVQTVDAPADGAAPRDLGRYLSLALDSHGRPGIAYFDGTAGDLRYARMEGGAFAVDLVDFKQSVGLYPSTVFRPDNTPAVAYYHRSKGDLRVAQRRGGVWRIDDIDRHPNDRGRSVSLAINSFNRLAAAYEDSTTGKLKFAVETSNGWVVDTIDNDTRGVSYISAAFDRTNRLGVSYYDASPADLKFAITNNPFQADWKRVTVAAKGTVGLFSQLRFDDSGVASIVYYNRNADSLFLARGNVNKMTATRVQPAGGRFASLTYRPDTGGLVYSYYRLTVQRLQFGEVLV